MTISYPLTPPATPSFIRFDMGVDNRVAVQESTFTKQQQVQGYSGNGWQLAVTLPQMARTLADPWIAFLVSLKGPLGTFMLGDPMRRTPQGSAVGAPQVANPQLVGATQLITRGWGVGQSGLLLPGDMFQIGNNLYMNLTSLGSDGSGVATIDIFPSLRVSYADTTPLVLTNPLGIWRLAQGQIPVWSSNLEKMNTIVISAVEAQ